ncbi:MAG: DUF4147 domain-containing protein [Nitrosopumilaceae archaeon]|nr:DUF4147 domain-containing protein [Nitrosopumilaceae archaeon]
MIIQDFKELSKTRKHRDALTILEEGLKAADPQKSIPKYVKPNKIEIHDQKFDLTKYSSVHTVAFGKSADSMTRVVNAIIPIKSGIIVIPKGSKSIIKSKKFQIFNSGHPKPDQDSVKAAKTVTKFLKNRKKDELVIFLVSGGGSALLALPDSITLSDKIHVTELLLRSGATIQEFNCIRKHLSKIKGGRLVENLNCEGLSLVLSDVEGDDLSAIASGTTYYDNTTFEDALLIIKKYKLEKKIPVDVINRIKDGINGNISETPKKSIIPNQIIANNFTCMKAMKTKAESLGYNVKSIQIFGDIKEAVNKIRKEIPQKEKSCLIFGGETTVQVIGKGKGGRNQELVLRLLQNSQKLKKIIIASVGTDGIDGNTNFAGAITENRKIDTSETKKYLKNSNSNSFFQKQGGLIKTGYTHTNLMDIGIILL